MMFSGVILVILVIYILIIYFFVKLQIKLSRKKEWWMGLILPMIAFVFACITVLGSSSYYTTATTQTLDENGVVIYEKTERLHGSTPGEVMSKTMPVFILMNIPTAILLAIYASQRSKLKPHEELNKMNIQDL